MVAVVRFVGFVVRCVCCFVVSSLFVVLLSFALACAGKCVCFEVGYAQFWLDGFYRLVTI